MLGAGGLIGRATIAEAERRGIEPVRGVGRSRPTPNAAPAGLASWDALDLATADPGTLRGLLRRYAPDVVVNCAGRTDGGAAELARANVVVTGAVVEAMDGEGPAIRLVQVGSAAEYGQPMSTTSATSEEQAARPLSMYGVTKLAATQLVLVAARTRDLDAAVARVFNPIGAGMPTASLAGRAVRMIRDAIERGTDRVEFGPLSAVRDFVDLRDIASALLTIGLTRTLDADLYNVGSGTGTVVRSIPTMVAERLGFAGSIVETGDGSPRSFEVGHQRADITRLARLGWVPRHDLGASIDALVAGLPGRP